MRGKHNHPVAEPLDMAFFVPTENFTGPDSASGGMTAEGPRCKSWRAWGAGVAGVAGSQALDQQGRIWFYAARLYSPSI